MATNRLTPRRHHRGGLQLVLISSAAALLPGCGPDPLDTPEPMSRAQYANMEDCLQDWRDESECEPRRTDASGATSSGGVLRWWGPYYTRSGQVYRYNGRVEQVPVNVSHAQGFESRLLSPRQVYASPTGRYANVPAAPGASPAKSAQGSAVKRGGFGSIGRGFSGGG
jgi:uncharacterized protein YgiB involved in biofilm formation